MSEMGILLLDVVCCHGIGQNSGWSSSGIKISNKLGHHLEKIAFDQ